jgi:transposase
MAVLYFVLMQRKRRKTRGTQEAQEAIRRRAVAAIRRGGSMKAVAETFGASYSAVRRWNQEHKVGGSKALASVQRGRKVGEGRWLSARQESQLRRWIIDATPDQLKLPFMLWERRAVQELIEQRFGLQIPLRTGGEYLARWGFSAQRPAVRFYEQPPQAVRRWLKETYPAIAARARQQRAEIHWADETGGTTSSASGARGFAPKGQTPLLKRPARALRLNVISSVTNQGKSRFMIYRQNFTAQIFIKFLAQIVRGAKGRRVIVMVDNLRVHHAKPVQKWLESNQARIALEYLPAYSPELHPDEYLNSDLKANVHRQRRPRDMAALHRNVRSHLTLINRRPKRVQSYFGAKHIQYAA